VLAGFAFAALVLACVGLYGIVAYSVEQRRRELGVRIALGASNRRLVGSVMSDAMLSMVAGLAVGALGSWFSVRVIRGMLFETTFADPGTIVGVVAVLATVTLLAAYRPALRATNTDPMLAIRSD
jgi:ABC-type antimicrobial peptide transport system permease subunit